MFEHKNVIMVMNNLSNMNINKVKNILDETQYLENDLKNQMDKIRRKKIKEASVKIKTLLKEDENTIIAKMNIQKDKRKEFQKNLKKIKEIEVQDSEEKKVIINTKSRGMLLLIEGRQAHFPIEEVKTEEWKNIYIDQEIIERCESEQVIRKMIEVEEGKEKNKKGS